MSFGACFETRRSGVLAGVLAWGALGMGIVAGACGSPSPADESAGDASAGDAASVGPSNDAGFDAPPREESEGGGDAREGGADADGATGTVDTGSPKDT